MKKSTPHLVPVPDRFDDGFFDVVVRDAGSAVIFWDLKGSIPFTECDERTALAIQATAIDCEDALPQESKEQTLTLHDFAGHLLLPLPDSARNFTIELGWYDSDNNFRAIDSESITLPAVANRLSTCAEMISQVALPSMRHARYGQIANAIGRRETHPGLTS